MGPDGVLTLLRIPVGLVAAGVHDLEVVEIAVGFVEVPVTVEVVAIPHVVGGQGGLDLGVGLTERPSARSTQTPTASSSRFQVFEQTLELQG